MEVAGASIGLMILFAMVGLGVFAFQLWMLIEILMKEPADINKIVWFLVVFLMPLLGSLIYFLLRRPQRLTEQGG